MQSRVDLFDRPGGDTIQLKKTKEELEKLGVEVDVSLELEPDISGYDLVHLFNLDRCHETYLQSLNAKRQETPVVLSSIHHRFSEIEEYERRVRFGLRRLINPLFRTYQSREYLKNIYRAIFDSRQRVAVLKQFMVGLRREQEELLQMVDAILPNAEAEALEIEKEFGSVVTPSWTNLVCVIPNGVEEEFAEADPSWFVEEFGVEDFILAVGRIEARKNQLGIIKAMSNVKCQMSNVRLVLIGRSNPNHPEYCWRVRREVKRNPWILHIESLPHEKIGSAFAAAKVHVSASFFETTGLVNCEAGLAGCNVVSTNRGYCQEYLGDDAWYCDPYDVNSISQAISKAYQAPRGNENLKKRILEEYTWEETAKKTMRVYEKILREQR